jgi:hypothetical protein
VTGDLAPATEPAASLRVERPVEVMRQTFAAEFPLKLLSQPGDIQISAMRAKTLPGTVMKLLQ